MQDTQEQAKRKRGRPAKIRKDPVFKPTTGGMHGMKLINKDPNKHYVFVDPNVKDWYSHYLSIGYTREVMEENGPRLLAGSTALPGDVFEARGCVLMSIDKSIREQMDEEGLAATRKRMADIRRARHIGNIRREYQGVFDDATIETFVDIPSREIENHG